MSSEPHDSSRDTSKAPPMIAPFEVFKFQYDSVTAIGPLGDYFPQVIATYKNTGITALQNTGYLPIIPIQFSKLMNYFNNYEEWTILEDRVDYMPEFRHSDTNADQTVSGVTTPTEASIDWLVRNAIFRDTSRITLIPDKNDHQLNSSLDSYFMMRSRPEARTFPLNKPYTFATRPTVNDLRIIASPSDSPIVANNPFIPNVAAGISSANANPWLEWGPPEKLGWLPTKVMNPSQNWVLNYTPNYYGYKEFLYFPIAKMQGTNSKLVEYGVKTFTLTFAFRKFDYRPLYTQPNPTSLLASREQLLDVLDDVTRRGMIYDLVEEPAFKKVKTDEEVQQDGIRSRVTVPESP